MTPQELRFLDILFVDPMVLKLGRGIPARVPRPAAFFLHKLFIAAAVHMRVDISECAKVAGGN